MTDAMDLSLLVSRRIADIFDLAHVVYKEQEHVGIWFLSEHPMLDGKRPIDVLRESGGIRRLEAHLETLESIT